MHLQLMKLGLKNTVNTSSITIITIKTCMGSVYKFVHTLLAPSKFQGVNKVS